MATSRCSRCTASCGVSADVIPPALVVRGCSKTFAGTRVLHDVDLDVERGEIHALLGQNGSGKSTLIKCLSGYHVPDPGASVHVGGEELDIPFLPAHVLGAGLRFVHQDLAIVPTMSVTENLGLGGGLPTKRSGRVDWSTAHAKACEALAQIDCANVDPRVQAGRLPLAVQTMIAVARALDAFGLESNPVAVVLDEPSASLPEHEVEILHRSIRTIAANGVAVLLISHRLPEVFALASKATVLRDGHNLGTFDIAGLDPDTLTDLIVGKALAGLGREVESIAPTTPVALSVRGLIGGTVRDLDLDVREGEVLGLAGLRGSGRSTIARLLSGAQPLLGGTIAVHGKEVGSKGVRDAVDAGIVYLPEDRKEFGIFPQLSVRENFLLPRLAEFRRPIGGINRGRSASVARDLVERYGVKPSQTELPIRKLSGGNQQKVVIGRWLSLDPKVAILDEPVQGIDVGAKADIFRILEEAAQTGVAIVMVDSDFENLSLMCHRILVMHEGRIASELTGADIESPEAIARAVFLANPSLLHQSLTDTEHANVSAGVTS
jgi:ribose transport system ATP-binding protein